MPARSGSDDPPELKEIVHISRFFRMDKPKDLMKIQVQDGVFHT